MQPGDKAIDLMNAKVVPMNSIRKATGRFSTCEGVNAVTHLLKKTSFIKEEACA